MPRLEPFRKTYNDNIDKLGTAAREAHAKLGEFIGEELHKGHIPDQRVRLAYDYLLLLSNTVNTVKGFTPSITFSDERGE